MPYAKHKQRTHNAYGMPIAPDPALVAHNTRLLAEAGCQLAGAKKRPQQSTGKPELIAAARRVIAAAKGRKEYLTYRAISLRIGKQGTWLGSALAAGRPWALDLQVDADELVQFADLDEWRGKGNAIPINLRALLEK
jgi:hypothetical protein